MRPSHRKPRQSADGPPTVPFVMPLPSILPDTAPPGPVHTTNESLLALVAEKFRERAALEGAISELLGELGRREAFRDEGATSLEAWIVARCHTSVPTARAFAQVAGRLWDLPHLSAGLRDGAISFDQVRAVVDTAAPETDAEYHAPAEECSVRELAELARASRQSHSETAARAEKEFEERSLRFNDTFRTVTAQLPAETYAEVRTCLEGRARTLPSDGETRWDQRLCDALLLTIRSIVRGTPAPYFVVAHVPIETLLEESSELAGELERGGLLSTDVVRRIACDATIAVAVDDDVGHTMYEGRATRDPTDAQRREVMRRDRHCRFPGCANVTFTNVHHLEPWIPRGRTDIDNLVLLCVHHHHRVHSRQWTLSGDANGELTFLGPTGRAMTSRPSPMWTAVTGPAARRAASPRGSGTG